MLTSEPDISKLLVINYSRFIAWASKTPGVKNIEINWKVILKLAYY